MATKKILTAARLREVLTYEPETGIFRWKVAHPNKRIIPGDIAGFRASHGYAKIGVSGTAYYAHRLAWLMMTGEWPPEEIDHKNGDRSDNRWSNLRAATHAQNNMNSFRSGRHFGVELMSWNPKPRWRARIAVNTAVVNLGAFDTRAEASEAYRRAALKYHGEFAKQSVRQRRTDS